MTDVLGPNVENEMTYPCHRCNMDDGSPLCLQDERCPQNERNAYGPAHLAPQPAPGLAFDARGVLAPIARERVADALLIVKSYGPWGADLNDAHRRQIVLAEALEAALFVLGMVDKNNRIDAGEKGKAWSGRFVVEEVRRVLALGPNG